MSVLPPAGSDPGGSGTFQPVAVPAALLVARTMAGTGDLAGTVLALLRDHGGALTLAEIRGACPSSRAPGRAALQRTLAALERVSLVHRRDLITDAGSEPCWWAPRVPFAMPWTRPGVAP